MNLGTAEVIRADSRNLPLADDSVDLVVTSPPYFALRSYQDGGEHYDGQIGAEPTPDEFVSSLLEVTAECVRVLKPSGSLWVNLGDKYASAGTTPIKRRSDDPESYAQARGARTRPTSEWFPHKSLMGLPWRYALRCIDDLGLILRAEVIWSKPNGLPESVTDRVRRSHEQWFHFTLSPRYFSAVDEIREPHSPISQRIAELGRAGRISAKQSPDRNDTERTTRDLNPLGKLPGSVWQIATEPLRVPDHLGVDHFAAFPTEWPKRIIQGWSPAGVCVECGEGRRPVSRNEITADRGGRQFNPASGNIGLLGKERVYEITGYVCACAEPTADTTPAVVLDPFGGTGTTAMVAKALGRHGISVDMSADYCRLAEWRTNDRDQLAKVLGIAKAEQEPDDAPDLFGLLDGEAS